MSKVSIHTGNCQRCENIIEMNIWDSINVSFDPEMKTKDMNRSAFFVECPSCGFKFTVNYGFLYHDMEGKYMLHYVQSEEEEQQVLRLYASGARDDALMAGNALMMGYRFRIVRSYNELVEKICIFDAGLDDKVMEIYKIIIELSGKTGQYDPERVRMLYDRPGNVDSILIVEDSRLKATIPISMDMYDSLKEKYSGREDGSIAEDLLINRDWAEAHME